MPGSQYDTKHVSERVEAATDFLYRVHRSVTEPESKRFKPAAFVSPASFVLHGTPL